MGAPVEARDLLLEVLADSSNDATACMLMGQACANLGEWEKAEEWSRQAVHLDPLMLKAYHTMALVLQHQGHLDQAISAMKKVIYLDRTHIVGHFGLAGLYRSNGQLPQALKSLDNAHRLLRNYGADEVVPESVGSSPVACWRPSFGSSSSGVQATAALAIERGTSDESRKWG